MRFRSFAVAGAVLLVAGCAPDIPASLQADDGGAGLGTSDLAPSLAPETKGAPARDKRAAKKANRDADQRDRPGDTAGSTSKERKPRTSRPSSAAAQPQGGGTPRPAATVADATGDVSAGLSGSPAHVDLTGATLSRDGSGFTLRLAFAGDVPARSTDSNIQNVASFYDLDGDGVIDYEVWATLADNGWSGSYRTPSGARFGDDSGVSAAPRGRELVVTFPAGHLQGATQFRWAVGAEWGTPEQIAAGTTASDKAPDGGVVEFPG